MKVFRHVDYLCQHPELAKKYEKIKLKLAKKYVYDREKYTDEKLDFVNNILGLAQKSN